MTSRKYTYTILILLALYTSFHGIVWLMVTSHVLGLESDMYVGDLARLSYSADSRVERKKRNLTLSKRHLNYGEAEQVDVVTIGSSVSNAGAGGTNPFYQDYIATGHNKKVMNIQLSGYGNIESILLLLDHHILEDLKVKSLILQVAERSIGTKLSLPVNWNLKISREEAIKIISTPRLGFPDKLNFINRLNFNAVMYNFLYAFDDNAFYSNVYKATLTEEMFTSKKPNQLLFFFKDIESLQYSTRENISKANDNLNKLQVKLAKIGVQLYFMPSVDKYSLYSDFIVNNTYGKPTTFEILRELPRDYTLIDTKKILRNMIDEHEKDIFYGDDTHWSYKASERIFKNIKFP